MHVVHLFPIFSNFPDVESSIVNSPVIGKNAEL